MAVKSFEQHEGFDIKNMTLEEKMMCLSEEEKNYLHVCMDRIAMERDNAGSMANAFSETGD